MGYWTDRLLDEPTVSWPPPVRDGLGGYTWLNPVQLMGRWQFSTGKAGPVVEYQASGALIDSSTSVWLEAAVDTGSYLWKGLVEDVPRDAIPGGALQVVSVSYVRSIPTRNYLYKVYLDES